MALKGDLASVGLADVFQMLAHNQKVGILSIHGKDVWRALYFDRRGVTLSYNEQTFLDRLLETLVRRNYVTTDLLDSLRRQNTGDPIATVESLLHGGLIQEELFLETFRTQMEEEIYDLFLWENVHWEFLEGESTVEGQEGVVNENFFFSADSLIMEAARRLDEWVFIREVVPGATEVFETIPGCSAEEVVGLDELTLSIFDLVDGKRNVARIVEVCQMTSFQVHKSLSVLAQKGFVQPLPEAKLMSNADECIAEARLDDGIRLLERAIQCGAGLPDAHLLVAKTYEMQAEVASACWHFKAYARLKVDAGEVDEGVAVLERAVKLIPTDLEAWERLVQGLMLQSAPASDPHSVGKDLIDLYLELDETERARCVLEDLIKSRPHDIELKKSLIAVHTKAGDTRRVMDLYESIADDLVADKDPIGAVRYLQKILMIDRNRKEISDRIKQLYVLDERHRSRRRSLALVMAGVLSCGTLGTIYYLYERNVRKVFAQLDPAPFLQENDFAGAIQMYEGFLGQYPLSFVGPDVKHEIDRIRGMQALVEAKQLAAKRELAAKARTKRERYKSLWAAYERASLPDLDLEFELKRLGDIRRLALEAGEPEDRQFLESRSIDEAIRSTRDVLENARNLGANVENALKEGKPAKAREIALRLHKEHPYTPTAAKTLVPFEVVTDPAGAQIKIDGKPSLDLNGEPLTTPAWVRLKYDDLSQMRLSRSGFRDLFFRVSGSQPSPVHRFLRVNPDKVFRLSVEPVTGFGIGDRYGFVGQRGGVLQCIDLATGKERYTKRLGGLDEVRGVPLVAGDRVVFATTHGWLYAIRIVDGKQLWRAKVDGDIRTNLVACSNGLVVGNHRGELFYFSLGDGERFWKRSTGRPPTSDPIWDGDLLWYTTRDGFLLALDIDDVTDAVVKRRDVPGAIGSPLRIGREIVFLGVDGKVHAYSTRRGGRATWQLEFTRDSEDAWLLSDRVGLIVVTSDGLVRRMDPRRPNKPTVLSHRLPRPVIRKPLRNEDGIYFVLRGDKGAAQVMKLDASDFSVQWVYDLPGGVRGKPTLKGRAFFVTGADRKVHKLP